MVEHVAQHQHAATHPLAGTGEFRVVELGHGAPAPEHGEHHLNHRFLTEAIALGQVVDDLQALWGQLFHGGCTLISLPYLPPSERSVRSGSKREKGRTADGHPLAKPPLAPSPAAES